MVENQVSGWMGRSFEGLNVIGVYNLLFNASLLVEEGAGYALCFDGIVQTPPDGPLCFKPLEPKLEVNMVVVWKKLQTFSKPARKFIERLEQELGQTPVMEK
jgi:DNA-binding transcriptional LysR family regulator